MPLNEETAAKLLRFRRIEQVPTGTVHEAIEHSVLGTALYEPVILAMRRLAHQHLAARRFSDD